MTKLLEQALEVARNLPSDVQDDIARVVLELAGADDTPPVTLTSDERAAIAKSKEAAARVNSPPTRRSRPSGQNTACENSIPTAGACRSQRDP
jgi:hypothetical protein